MAEPTARRSNREKLLDAARVCVRERGYAGTTARDLAGVSGTSLAAIGYHFGSKEALLNEAVVEGAGLWAGAIEAEAGRAQGTEAGERLRRALAAIVDRFAELEPYIVSFVDALPAAVRSPDIREHMASAHGRARDALTALFESALNADGASAEVLASLFLALSDGLLLQWLMDRDRSPHTRSIVEVFDAVGPALAAGRVL